jgi:hypothetical protein
MLKTTAILLFIWMGFFPSLFASKVELRVALERGFVQATHMPLSLNVKNTLAELIERTMARLGFGRAEYGLKQVIDEILGSPTLTKLCQTAGHESQIWHRLAEFCHLFGDEATAASTRGWTKIYQRSLKIEGDTLLDDRMPDLYKLAKADTPEGKAALKKSLEEFGATDGSGKFWLRDLDKIQAEGYRYSNFDPRFDRLGNPIEGSPKLSVHDTDGCYAGLEKIDTSAGAKSRYQLPETSTAQYRLEFDWEAVKNNVRVPRGDQGRANYIEPMCKDFPNYGQGGGGQLLIDGVEVPIKSIWDISGSIPIKIYPN